MKKHNNDQNYRKERKEREIARRELRKNARGKQWTEV